MIERSNRIQTYVWPGFHMIARSDRIQAFVCPGIRGLNWHSDDMIGYKNIFCWRSLEIIW